MHHHHRRRKKRPNYGTRTVEVSRGFNGFGFTISGQQPCILSCIVANSPADLAGLRAGDFLISVNGLNVSKLPHEAVVQLIGNSLGTIRMQIAENYFSDSSDEDNVANQSNRVKPRYLHHKLKMNRLRNSPQKSEAQGAMMCDQQQPLRPVIEDIPLPIAHSIIHSANASTSKDISNVSAMVRKANAAAAAAAAAESLEPSATGNASLEYRAIVGYLGTIEMPKQIATSSKLQTVRSCIRKMRQEKRNPTTVLMTILPTCLTLRSSSATVLATYPASRLNYVSSSSESENRFFGLVTSAIYASVDDEPVPLDGIVPLNRDITISNSCHVFVIDTKICDHLAHEQKAVEFKISCTKDPISNLCLEFPNNSEYVVNLIRSMYTMKVLPPAARNVDPNQNDQNGARNRPDAMLPSNSPQPSNHSEVTTTSSNSDSGIGFHNDCTNISDRILVVDFPGLLMNRNNNSGLLRPVAICNNIEPVVNNPPPPQVDVKPKPIDFNTRLTVRAMPDPKVGRAPLKQEVPDLLVNFPAKSSPTLTATRSCDDVITSVERDEFMYPPKKQLQMSIDDITMLQGSSEKDHVFAEPDKPTKRTKKTPMNFKSSPNDSSLMSYKLSPKVFFPRPESMSLENRSDADLQRVQEIWGSLQDLHQSGVLEQPNGKILEGTYSEPDLVGPSREFARRSCAKTSRALPSAESPFRRWGQSSFRSSRSNDQRAPLSRRPSSLAASENDVYTKSIDGFGDGDLESQRSQSEDINGFLVNHHQNTNDINNGVTAWGSSFEKLLDDPAGLHTFAEFLKKEFSAENIYFWTACERYRQIIDNDERAERAMEIFTKHLATGALEPVNVDSQARNTAEENLQAADKNLFNQAQKQIFNLMKFDSYQRFIRSELYKKCLEAESKNHPLPYPGDQLDEMLRTTLTSPGPSKLKKSLSNAEDRRRKSLLPWHRKVRCKSRDRSDSDARGNGKSIGKNNSSGNVFKSATNNSTSDIHSSRSSLSSFDAAAAAMGTDESKTCSLCRVILCDGATTIVQTRQNETVRQLVERLLEKRGIHYPCFDVMLSGNTKAIDLDNPSTMIAGKEVQIEQRVAFKLDLPDPKVISVRSKPKKALGDVLRPILHKYNYKMEDVQVIFRDTHEVLEMNMPVTVADGQRLQVVLVKPDGWQQDNSRGQAQPNFKTQPAQISFGNKMNGKVTNQQSTLDEITNKVFNELLQGKVESHGNQGLVPKASDQSSLRSEECESETSSIFGRLKRRDSNNPPMRTVRPKKVILPHQNKPHQANTDENALNGIQPHAGCDQTTNGIKKPLIAKWKTGVKLQVTGRPENHEEFLEGLNRAQRARLEDQRGTEINSELPDFLKDKENHNSANKSRKTRIPSNGMVSVTSPEPVASIRTNFEATSNLNTDKPQPAPRFSINKTNGQKMDSSTRMDTSISESSPNTSSHSNEIEYDFASSKGPPPLPPKPKILPIKPSNWGHTSGTTQASTPAASINSNTLPSKIPIDITRRHLNVEQNARNIYLDQPSSSFV